MTFDGWYLTIGALLTVVAVLASYVKRLPLTETIIYLLAGLVLGPLGLGLASLDPLKYSHLLERLSELGVIVSLFTAGLKLRLPPTDRLWRLPLRLASLSMVITVGLIAAAGVTLLGLSPGAAVLLGAILAPTDPVLASDVQVEHPSDRDRLRFGLTGEAGLNDGAAFPFVMLGLGMLGLHDLGSLGFSSSSTGNMRISVGRPRAAGDSLASRASASARAASVPASATSISMSTGMSGACALAYSTA
jgi:NhaP-type Na+/H+ or K+/H+ antiporter